MPIFRGIGVIFKTIYSIAFSWWLDPRLQRKANEALWNTLQSNFYFLTSRGQRVEEKALVIHPFDYASIRIVLDNLCFCFTQGRGEFNVSLSPARSARDSYPLAWVIAALDSKEAKIDPVGSLDDAARVVKLRLDELEDAFSDREFPEFRKKLSMQRDAEHMRTRQLEWELNQRLYGDRNRIRKP